MTTATITPEAIAASEPVRKRGIKTPYNKEGDRSVTYRWTIGASEEFGKPVTATALLDIHHRKASESRRGAHYSATLFRETDDGSGIVGIKFDGRNGTVAHTQTAGAARFKEGTLLAFAEYALQLVREQIDNPKIRAYFTPEGP